MLAKGDFEDASDTTGQHKRMSGASQTSPGTAAKKSANENEDSARSLLGHIPEGPQGILEQTSPIPSTKPSKDGWDKFAAMSSFISALLVAAIGGYFTYTYNSSQSARDTAAKDQQNRIAEIQTVGQFMPYLLAPEEHKKQMAIFAISLLGNKELAAKLNAYSPSPGTVAAISTINSAGPPQQAATTAMTSEGAGHTILLDGFRYYANSALSFSKAKVVPWGSEGADIEVANPDLKNGGTAVFFVENDTPPYTAREFPAGRTPANGGIIKMSQTSLEQVVEAPASGYAVHYFIPEAGGVYCVRTWDGLHYAKLHVLDVSRDRIAFEWVFQPNGTRSFP
jgi:hypothetical protein